MRGERAAPGWGRLRQADSLHSNQIEDAGLTALLHALGANKTLGTL